MLIPGISSDEEWDEVFIFCQSIFSAEIEKMAMNGSSSVSYGYGDRIDDVGKDEFPANFKDHMLEEGLSWSLCKPDHHWTPSYGFVFWNNNVDFIPGVCVSPQDRDKIRDALQKIIWYANLEESLVQFWAPTKTSEEGRTLLRTQYQPFALGKKFHMFGRQCLCKYRMTMMGSEYNFYADEESGQEQLGLLGRVFRNKSAEFIPDVKHSSLKDYPQLDFALSCKIKRSWALPVIEHSSRTCVGVLEIVSLRPMDSACHDIWFLDRMYRIFQDQGVTLQLGSLDQQSIDGINNGMNGFSVSQNSILPSPEPLQNGEVTTQVDSSDQPPMDPSNNGQNVATAEGNITEVTSSKEGRRKRQAREHKQTGGRIEITREDILKHSEKRRKVAARELKVSISTLRRNCRRYGINRWPPRNIENVCPFSLFPVENQGQTLQNTILPSSQASASVARTKLAFQDADMVTIKVKYVNGMFRIPLSLSSTLVELQQEVTKRLNQLKQEAGTYLFEYKDEEEDLVTIACDEDLQSCIRTSRSPGKPLIVVQLKAI